ncbi:MAG: isochorismatase family cysteine hydrolase [Rubrivivax sp.]
MAPLQPQQGAAGALARTLRPLAGDCTLLKPRHSAFHGTALDLLLRQLACKRLIVTGLATDNCVLFTAMDAYLRGYELGCPRTALPPRRPRTIAPRWRR